MALLPILEFPDPRLRTRAQPVEQVDAALRKLIDDMFETMYAAPGVGLAATQVNVHKRFMVIDVSESRKEPLVFINPEILERQGVEATADEQPERCVAHLSEQRGIARGVERDEVMRVVLEPAQLGVDGAVVLTTQTRQPIDGVNAAEAIQQRTQARSVQAGRAKESQPGGE